VRLAILISGHIRSLEQSQKNLTLLRELFPSSDLFIHTWDSSEMNNNSHHKPYFEVNKIYGDWLEAFNPKNKLIENQIEINLDDKFNYILKELPKSMRPAALGFYWMIYGISKSTELMIKEEYVSFKKYDYVIRWRFDLIIENFVDILNDLNILKLQNNSVILSSNKIWWPLGVYSDVFWIAERSFHERFVSSINRSIYNDVLIFKNSNLFLPELVLTNVIKKLNFKIISSSGIFKLKRVKEDHLISRINFTLLSKYRDLRFCWYLITANPYSFKSTLVFKKDLLNVEWQKNVFFPLNFPLIAKVTFIFISLIQKIQKTWIRFN
jgi:hypothetical protein